MFLFNNIVISVPIIPEMDLLDNERCCWNITDPSTDEQYCSDEEHCCRNKLILEQW